ERVELQREPPTVEADHRRELVARRRVAGRLEGLGPGVDPGADRVDGRPVDVEEDRLGTGEGMDVVGHVVSCRQISSHAPTPRIIAPSPARPMASGLSFIGGMTVAITASTPTKMSGPTSKVGPGPIRPAETLDHLVLEQLPSPASRSSVGRKCLRTPTRCETSARRRTLPPSPRPGRRRYRPARGSRVE